MVVIITKPYTVSCMGKSVYYPDMNRLKSVQVHQVVSSKMRSVTGFTNNKMSHLPQHNIFVISNERVK